MVHQPQSFLRFNHREIAVVFSLFIFTSLLMFTVGVLVGKGLAHPTIEWSSEKGDPLGTVAKLQTSEMMMEPELVPQNLPNSGMPSLAQPSLITPPAMESMSPNRGVATRPPKSTLIPNLPKAAMDGKFTVQVGSYNNRQDAEERVIALKKLGFTGSYVTAKEVGEKRETWYRVWLGNYSDLESAQRSGQILQDHGEVRNYLVRKTVPVD